MWSVFEKGGSVMYPLLAFSILALGVVIDRGLFWISIWFRSKPSTTGRLESERIMQD